jgi:hypothetical protein
MTAELMYYEEQGPVTSRKGEVCVVLIRQKQSRCGLWAVSCGLKALSVVRMHATIHPERVEI